MKLDFTELQYTEYEDDPAHPNIKSEIKGHASLVIDGDEIKFKDRLPGKIIVDASLSEIIRAIRESEKDGESTCNPFRCTCGAPGCSGVKWYIKEEGENFRIDMQDHINDKQITRFSVSKEEMKEQLTEILKSVDRLMEKQEVDTYRLDKDKISEYEETLSKLD